MRLTLVQPPQGSRFGFTKVLLVEPLGLECIAAAVATHGHQVRIVDGRLDKPSGLYTHLKEFQPGALGIACGFTTDVYSTLHTAGRVRDALPDLPIFAGGHHASLIPGDLLFPGSPIDAVVIGEGEWSATELVDALERGDDPASVPGVMTLANQRKGFEARRLAVNLDDVPLPARALTRRYRRHYHHGFAVPSSAVETSRGCPFDCNFCSIWVFYQRRARRRSPERIVEDLAQVKALGEQHVFFTDDIAFLQNDAYEELAHLIRKNDLQMHFSAETRADLVVKYEDLFTLWKEIGMNTIFLGIEKFDDEGLDSIRKRTKGGANTNLRAIEVLLDRGITPMTSLITDPAWGAAEFDGLERFVKRMRLPNPTFTVLTPLPGTELWETRKHEITTDDYSFFDVMHLVLPSTLPTEEFYERFSRLYRLAEIRANFSVSAVWNLVKMGIRGHSRVVRRVYGAVKDMRTAREYQKYPGSLRKPEFAPDRHGSVGWVEEGRSHLAERIAAELDDDHHHTIDTHEPTRSRT